MLSAMTGIMRQWLLLVGLLGTSGLAARIRPARMDDQLDVRAFRFFRADGGLTLVTGLIEIPYRLFTVANGQPRVAGDVEVSVRDSAGLELHRSAWHVGAPAASERDRAALVEVVEFTLVPGRYDLQVTVHDSVSGTAATRRLPIVAFPASPPASDVVLSPSIRLPEPKDTMLAPGERRWGGLIVTPAANVRLTPVRARLFYLVEVYPGQDATVTMTARVLDDSGRVVVATPPRPVPVLAAGAVLRGQVDLTGLPAGHYRMSVALDEGGLVEERSDRFAMADFGETMQQEQVRLAAMRLTDDGYFGLMNQERLNEAEAPLAYLTTPDSLSVWNTGLSLAARREFMVRFWGDRDPTPATVRNEAREAFYARIEDANRKYGVGGRTPVPGWRSDRGRIAVRNGDPSEQLDRRLSSGTAPPFIVWRYQRGKARYYIFADRTGFGVYQLIASNDLKETGLPGYREILGGEALQDISRWLGLDLFQDDRGFGGHSPS